MHQLLRNPISVSEEEKEAYLVPIDEDYCPDAPGPYTQEDGGPWVAQILRSITSDSAEFSPSRSQNLHRKYGRYIDNSIAKAYVNAIRNARNYVYIENQYFLGSAFAWLKEKATKSHAKKNLRIELFFF